MSLKKAAIAVCNSHSDAEAVIKELERDGFDMKRLSIIGKDFQTEEHIIGYYNTGDRIKYWGKLGAFWGGLCGLLFGSGVFFIPGVGHVMVLGPLVGWIVGALENAAVVGGLTALSAGLVSIGIPKDSLLNYETQIKAGKFLVIAQGTSEEVEAASQVIDTFKPALSAAHNR